ncbi:hypothetical protein ANN_00360 [Periplaneta americana]|uniref:Proline dehydrogenase n=1 Tax=Periplaneta americana TaxID=6978 RepID=A0ABQ8TSZ0_PERAM|nr:hypothetical protein ANN_00360 [Periplaneta americana]
MIRLGLQLSEVIMRTRKYMTEVLGGEGNVLTHHVHVEDLEKKFLQAGLEEETVKKFLKQLTYDKEGVIHLFPWSGIVDENQQLSDTFRVPDLKTGRMVRLITQLTPKEEEMFRNMVRRMNSLCKTADELDVRVMVDAEQTYFQPAISRITLEMMRKYNKDKAVVFNTYQCYLKNTYEEATNDLEQAKRQNFYFGAKLVRGAYLEQERARAAALGYTDPTNASFEATTEMYHRTLTECLRRIKDLKDRSEDARKIAIMVASHNEDTVRFAIEKSTGFLNMCSHNVVSTGCNKSPLCILCYFKMNDVIDNPADCEVRSVIRFLSARHLKPAKIYRQLKEVYGDTVMNERNVRKWCEMFNNGRANVHDETRLGRPSLIIEDLKTKVNRILQDRRTSLNELLKDFLGGTRFGSDEELKKTLNTWLNELAAEEYNTGILKLVNRYDKCLNVGQSGYSAYKYIPYGPINEVLPYLSRRAHENKGILKKIRKEKKLLLRELRRRITSGQLMYRPRGNYVPV